MTRKHGNPIKALGQFMNSCQSSGLAFQVNDFKGGSSSGTYPSFAQMTITVNKNDEKKLLETFDTIRKNFEDSYRDNENSLKISCTKCKTPNTSYSEEDTANIMSFLYTVKDGTFATENDDEDGEAVAVANIGFASEKGKNGFVLGMKGRSINPGIFKKCSELIKILRISAISRSKRQVHSPAGRSETNPSSMTASKLPPGRQTSIWKNNGHLRKTNAHCSMKSVRIST